MRASTEMRPGNPPNMDDTTNTHNHNATNPERMQQDAGDAAALPEYYSSDSTPLDRLSLSSLKYHPRWSTDTMGSGRNSIGRNSANLASFFGSPNASLIMPETGGGARQSGSGVTPLGTMHCLASPSPRGSFNLASSPRKSSGLFSFRNSASSFAAG